VNAPYPVTRRRGHRAKVVAWLMLAGAALGVTLMVAGAIIRASDGDHQLSAAQNLATGLGTVVVVTTALALLLLRTWARVAGALEFTIGAGGFFVLMVYLARNPPAEGDGQGYEVMGAAFWGLGCLAAAIVLIVPSTWRSRPNPLAGWYRDPLAGDKWRYWTGESWSGYTS
jgi:hypothetical protein